jgi:biopolymer transport protein ExbD
MARARSNPPTAGIFEPNMTPLIDVSLVLVVILMVATPLAFQSAIAVRSAASSGRAATTQTDADRIEVSIGADGTLKVDRTTVTRETLQMAIAQRLGGSRSRMVVVHAEPAAKHGLVVGVLDDARSAGAAEIALAER